MFDFLHKPHYWMTPKLALKVIFWSGVTSVLTAACVGILYIVMFPNNIEYRILVKVTSNQIYTTYSLYKGRYAVNQESDEDRLLK